MTGGLCLADEDPDTFITGLGAGVGCVGLAYRCYTLHLWGTPGAPLGVRV